MEPPQELTFERPCPFCGEQIAQAAVKCRYCKAAVLPEFSGGGAPGALERMMIPVGRPASAIAAGYLGLFSVLPFFGVAAIVVSLLAFRTLNRNPLMSGRGRAAFGLVMGTIMTLLYAIPLVALLVSAVARKT